MAERARIGNPDPAIDTATDAAVAPAIASPAGVPALLARSAGLAAGFGNAANARAVLALQGREPGKPDPDAEERVAFFKAEHKRLRREGAGLAVNYTKQVDAALEHAQVDFSALELAKAHGPVPRETTELTPEAVAAGVKGAWKKVFGTDIPANALALLIGKWKAEGGTTKGGVHNYNFGNVQVKDKNKPDYDYQEMKAPEHTGPGGAVEEKVSPFAAFKSVEHAAMGLIHFLLGSDKKGPSRAILGVLMFGPEGQGTVRHYCLIGFAKGYFTVDPVPIRFKNEPPRTNYFDLMRGHVPERQAARDAHEPAAAEARRPAAGLRADGRCAARGSRWRRGRSRRHRLRPRIRRGGGGGGAGGGGSRDDPGGGGAEGGPPA